MNIIFAASQKVTLISVAITLATIIIQRWKDFFLKKSGNRGWMIYNGLNEVLWSPSPNKIWSTKKFICCVNVFLLIDLSCIFYPGLMLFLFFFLLQFFLLHITTLRKQSNWQEGLLRWLVPSPTTSELRVRITKRALAPTKRDQRKIKGEGN